MIALRVLETKLAGIRLIEPEAIGDERGFFIEAYSRRRYAEAGIDVEFVQDNHSRSVRGTIRGLHYQLSPGQPKLVRVVRGAAFDVVVDLRRRSPTFGQYESFVLDDATHRQLFIPVGFAHGFCATSEVVDFVYKVGSYYDPATERGIAWDDPAIGIQWPVESPKISARDRANPRLADVAAELPW